MTSGAGTMLCVVKVAGQQFGLDTRLMREVLGECPVRRVPLSPAYIAGVVTYHGEPLTTVSLRAVLGLEPQENGGESYVLVLDCDVSWEGKLEQFGLQVDNVGSVVAVGEDLLRVNAPILSEAYKSVCRGAFRTQRGIVVQLDPEQLKPVQLARQIASRGLHAGTEVLAREKRGAA